MRAKPWQTRPTNPVDTNVSEMIQSTCPPKEEMPKIPTEASKAILTASPGVVQPSAVVPGYGSSSYGGYGGNAYGGSMLGGSMYGGGMLGGGSMLGGMLGGGMYGGGMYGGGMMGGMFGGMQGATPNENITNAVSALQMFGMLINSLCEIARSLDMNYEGFLLFKQSISNIYHKTKDGVKGGFMWVFGGIISLVKRFIQWVVDNVLCLGQKEKKHKYKAMRIMVNIALVILVATCVPNILSFLNGKNG